MSEPPALALVQDRQDLNPGGFRGPIFTGPPRGYAGYYWSDAGEEFIVRLRRQAKPPPRLLVALGRSHCQHGVDWLVAGFLAGANYIRPILIWPVFNRPNAFFHTQSRHDTKIS